MILPVYRTTRGPELPLFFSGSPEEPVFTCSSDKHSRKRVKCFVFLRVQRQDSEYESWRWGISHEMTQHPCVSSLPPFGATEVGQGEYLDARPIIC